jgi:hypothetical protein
VGYAEYSQRALLARWADYLERPAAAPRQTSLGTDAANGHQAGKAILA